MIISFTVVQLKTGLEFARLNYSLDLFRVGYKQPVTAH